MLSNITTPDGYSVNENGAWVVNGVVQTQAVQTGQQQPDVPKTNLMDLEPVASNGYYKETNRKTHQNQLWSDCFIIGTRQVSYAQYYINKGYSTFSFTYVPEATFDVESEYALEIYGDNDTLLGSFNMDYETTPQTVSVDVSGNDYIKIYCNCLEGWAASYVLIKDAVLK